MGFSMSRYKDDVKFEVFADNKLFLDLVQYMIIILGIVYIFDAMLIIFIFVLTLGIVNISSVI